MQFPNPGCARRESCGHDRDMFAPGAHRKKLAILAFLWLCGPVFAEITPRAPYVVTPDAAAVEGGPPEVANPAENPGSWRPVLSSPRPQDDPTSLPEISEAVGTAGVATTAPGTVADVGATKLLPLIDKRAGPGATWLTVNPDTGLVAVEAEPIEEMSEERAAMRLKVVANTQNERAEQFAEMPTAAGTVTEYLHENRYTLVALTCLVLGGFWGATALAKLSVIKPKRRRRRKSRSSSTSQNTAAKEAAPTAEGRRRSKSRSRHHSSSRSERRREHPGDPAAGNGVG